MRANSLLPLQKEAAATTVYLDCMAQSFRGASPHLNNNTAQLKIFSRSAGTVWTHSICCKTVLPTP